MPTPGGLPKVGEYLVWPDGTRRKVLKRDGHGVNVAVRVEDPRDPRGYKLITEVRWWIKTVPLRIEGP